MTETGDRTEPKRADAADSGNAAELVDTVGALIELMSAGGITELDVSTGSLAIRLRGGSAGEPVVTPPVAVVAPPPEIVMPQPAANEHAVTAPMIGTFYISPAPGEPPFVRPGDRVDAGQTIGIIEAMKIMNEIAADRSGTISELVASNGQAVEYGSPLVRLILDS